MASLEKISEFTTNLDVSASWQFINVKATASESNKVTLKIGSETSYSKKDEIEVEKPFSITVPPRTICKVSYSDTKKRVQIPVDLTVTLRANQYQEIRALAGNVQERKLVKILNDMESAPKRTVSLHAILVIKGGDRQLRIRLDEEACSPEQ
ncbi:hypothetical protein [Mesorhizobium sp.]|uniref:hypothetical protein n=1 Tax=Mesorhizobium sp. TaxID=1871066 RepID=UPI002580B335|nr:hypothetical protein [Mesorhizobium sp.]